MDPSKTPHPLRLIQPTGLIFGKADFQIFPPSGSERCFDTTVVEIGIKIPVLITSVVSQQGSELKKQGLTPRVGGHKVVMLFPGVICKKHLIINGLIAA